MTGARRRPRSFPRGRRASSGRPSSTVPETTSARRAAARPSSANGRRVRPAIRRDGNVARRDAARPPPRAVLSSSRPSRTAATMAARTRATCPSSMSCPRQSASAPASSACTAPSSIPTVALTAFISSASVTIVPVNPSSSRSSPVSRARLSVAGTSSTAGTTRWADMIARRAGGDRRAERRELDLEQLLARRRDDGQAEVRVDVGGAVAGKVLRAGGDSTRLEPASRTRRRGGRRAPGPSRTSGRRSRG